MATAALPDTLHLWWLADPAQPRLVGTLRSVRRQPRQPGGVSLEYSPSWMADGIALSEDLPLKPGEFLPAEQKSRRRSTPSGRAARASGIPRRRPPCTLPPCAPRATACAPC
jgi:serine/threonine-protein kinase HipA